MPNCPKCDKPVYFGKIIIATLLRNQSNLNELSFQCYRCKVFCANHRAHREQSSFYTFVILKAKFAEMEHLDLQIKCGSYYNTFLYLNYYVFMFLCA